MTTFSHEAFVKRWLSAVYYKLGVEHVSRVFDITPQQASQYATDLRQNGVNLPKMPRSKARYSINVERLNKIISESK